MKPVASPSSWARAKGRRSSTTGISPPLSSVPSTPSDQAAHMAVPRRTGPPASRLARTVGRTNLGMPEGAKKARRARVSAIAALVKRSKRVSTYSSRSMPGTANSRGRASRARKARVHAAIWGSAAASWAYSMPSRRPQWARAWWEALSSRSFMSS